MNDDGVDLDQPGDRIRAGYSLTEVDLARQLAAARMGDSDRGRVGDGVLRWQSVGVGRSGGLWRPALKDTGLRIELLRRDEFSWGYPTL